MQEPALDILDAVGWARWTGLMAIVGLLSCTAGTPGTVTPQPSAPVSDVSEAEDASTPESAVAEPASKSEIEALLPAVAQYEVLPELSSPAWLDDATEVWVAAQGGCHRAGVSGGGESELNVELCRKTQRRETTVCSTSMRREDQTLGLSTVECTTSGGADTRGSMSAGGGEALTALTATDSEVVYGDAWQLFAEPAAVIIEEAPCEPGSAERARAIVRKDPTVHSAGEDELLREQFGVVGETRRCYVTEQLRLGARKLSERGTWDRGAGLRTSDTAVDCASRCPAQPLNDQARAINAWLASRRFVETDASARSPTLSLHPTQEACEAAAASREARLPTATCEPVTLR